MRELNPAEAAERMEWLSRGDWPPAYGDGRGDTGYDHTEGWAGAVWVLHAMYEWAGPAPAFTHHEAHQQAIAAALREPLMVTG
jgi:hypothetical protein